MQGSFVRSFEVVVERSHMPVSKRLPASHARCGRSNGPPEDGLVVLLRRIPTTLRARPALTDARRGRGRQRRTSCGRFGANNASLAIALSWIPSGPVTYATFSSTGMSPPHLVRSSPTTTTTTASPLSSEAIGTTLKKNKEPAAACGSRYGTRRDISPSKRPPPQPPRNDGTSASIGGGGEKVAAARTDRPRRRRGRSRGPRDGGGREDRGQPSTARTAAPVGRWTTALAAPPPASHYDDATNAVFVLLIDAAGLYELLAVTHSGQSDRATAGDYLAVAAKQSTLSSAQSTAAEGCSSCLRMRTSASRVRVLTKRVSNRGCSSPAPFAERAVWSLETPSNALLPGEVLVGIPAGQSAAKALHLARKVLFKSPAVASILTQRGPRKMTSARTNGSGSEGESNAIPMPETPNVADPLMRHPRNALPPRPSRASRPPLCPRKPCFVEAPTAVLQDMRHAAPEGVFSAASPAMPGTTTKGTLQLSTAR
jgi:hypothetical protein